MTNNYWRIEYCISPCTRVGDPFDDHLWENFNEVKQAFENMMTEAGFTDKAPSCVTQYGFCVVIEYIFDLYKNDCVGMEDDQHTIKQLSPGGNGYEKVKKFCKEKNYYLNVRSSSYLP